MSNYGYVDISNIKGQFNKHFKKNRELQSKYTLHSHDKVFDIATLTKEEFIAFIREEAQSAMNNTVPEQTTMSAPYEIRNIVFSVPNTFEARSYTNCWEVFSFDGTDVHKHGLEKFAKEYGGDLLNYISSRHGVHIGEDTVTISGKPNPPYRKFENTEPYPYVGLGAGFEKVYSIDKLKFSKPSPSNPPTNG